MWEKGLDVIGKNIILDEKRQEIDIMEKHK